MAVLDVLQYPEGAGWLVLSGGWETGSAIRAQTLQRAMAEGGVAYIGLSEDSADDTLDDLEDLGAPTGYLVNILAEDDETIRSQIRDASIIVIDANESSEALHSSLMGAAVEAMLEAYQRGSVILVEGTSASVLGGYLPVESGEIVQGLNWIQNALILPDTLSLTDSDLAQDILETEGEAVVIGIGVGSALVLGPSGTVETWGHRQVTIALGRGYRSE